MHSLPFSDSIAHEALFQSKWKVALYGNDLLNVFLVVKTSCQICGQDRRFAVCTIRLIVKYIFHDKQGISIRIGYGEAQPASHPLKVVKRNERRYTGIGKLLVSFGVELSLSHGYDGTVYFKAKSTELLEHYIRDFGAIPIPAGHYMLIIFGDVAIELLNEFKTKEGV